MRRERCLVWVGVVAFASVAGDAGRGLASSPDRCMAFRPHNDDAVIRNSCSECRTALIRWCDGFTISLQVPGESSHSINSFAGCEIRVLAERACSPSVSTISKAVSPPVSSPQHLAARQKLRTQKREEGHPREVHEAATLPAPMQMAPVSPADEDGARHTSLNVVAPDIQADRAAAGPRFSWLKALFPGGSPRDWDALACSSDGANLIKQSEALLKRKELLQALLVEIWFNSEPEKKRDEWRGAQMEIAAIERELERFEGRAKEMLTRIASN